MAFANMSKFPEQKQLIKSAMWPTLNTAALRSTNSVDMGRPSLLSSGTKSAQTMPLGAGTRWLRTPVGVSTPICKAPKMAGQTFPTLHPRAMAACNMMSTLFFFSPGVASPPALGALSPPAKADTSSPQSTRPARKPPTKEALSAPKPRPQGMRCTQLMRTAGASRPMDAKALATPAAAKFCSRLLGTCWQFPASSRSNSAPYSTVISSQMSSASPQESSPGPRCATEAGTATVTLFDVKLREALIKPWSSSLAAPLRLCFLPNCTTSGNAVEPLSADIGGGGHRRQQTVSAGGSLCAAGNGG
mmetsp:Transcript_100733/g.289436  ORF Transcript_100733/g.289436 Transcript_100733/m.289436 type:complete len:303 (-) Transcript_100733:15-923(-)